jgi:hypothetical protein
MDLPGARLPRDDRVSTSTPPPPSLPLRAPSEPASREGDDWKHNWLAPAAGSPAAPHRASFCRLIGPGMSAFCAHPRSNARLSVSICMQRPRACASLTMCVPYSRISRFRLMWGRAQRESGGRRGCRRACRGPVARDGAALPRTGVKYPPPPHSSRALSSHQSTGTTQHTRPSS